jgi:acetyl esterase/lipase
MAISSRARVPRPWPARFGKAGLAAVLSVALALGVSPRGAAAAPPQNKPQVRAFRPNYRLSPAVRHPEHVKDAARAFDWAYRHCGEYGGDRRQLFVGGHSAGGHLAALLATDPTYLNQVGRAEKEIRGVIGVIGVYRVDDFDLKLHLAGPRGAMRLNLAVRPSAVVFGDDPKAVRQASPLTHVRPGLPPFLLLTAGWDYPPLGRVAKEFGTALKKNGCQVREKEIPWRTHETVLFDIPRLSADRATAGTIVGFIERNSQAQR